MEALWVILWSLTSQVMSLIPELNRETLQFLLALYGFKNLVPTCKQFICEVTNKIMF